jgi:hypothetical protein
LEAGWKRRSEPSRRILIGATTATPPPIQVGSAEPALAARAVLLERDPTRRCQLVQGSDRDPEVRGSPLRVQPAAHVLPPFARRGEPAQKKRSQPAGKLGKVVVAELID